MADLIQEFFMRDLSETEHDELGKLLQGSPDAALRYEGLLEQNYLATGLPMPSLPKGLQNLRHPGSGGLAGGSGLAKVLIVALAAAAVVAWKFWPRSTVEVPVPTTQTKIKLRHVLPRRVQPQPANPAAEGQELSVVVDSPQTALVTVRILDGAGREMRSLYTGFVQPGHWSFQWDGMLSDGSPAPAGDYRIDVQSGALHQTKDIKIKLK